MLHKQYYVEKAKVDKLVARKNQKSDFYNGIYDRYQYPVLTREFAPVHWRYDLNEEMTGNPSLRWQKVTMASMASTSGIIRWFCRTPVRRRPMSTICV